MDEQNPREFVESAHEHLPFTVNLLLAVLESAERCAACRLKNPEPYVREIHCLRCKAAVLASEGHWIPGLCEGCDYSLSI